MDNLMNVAFEAHHAELNHHRRYEITIGRDLLDDWTVSIRYGRTGSGGHVLRYAGQDKAKLQAIVKERLRRRLSAPKRIGCSYRLNSLNSAPGFDSGGWLPGDVMAGFFVRVETPFGEDVLSQSKSKSRS